MHNLPPEKKKQGLTPCFFYIYHTGIKSIRPYFLIKKLDDVSMGL